MNSGDNYPGHCSYAVSCYVHDDSDMYCYTGFNEQHFRQRAWKIIYDNPGIGFEKWSELMVNKYGCELEYKAGDYPSKPIRKLFWLWCDTIYDDPNTPFKWTFAEWARNFVNERSVELYDLLAAVSKHPCGAEIVNTKYRS